MKVLFDHQTFSLQDYGGISRIYAELLKGSASYPNVETNLSVLFSNNAYLKELDNIKYFNFINNSNWKYKRQVMMKANKMNSIAHLKYSKFDVFHPTYYDPYFLENLNGKPFVVTFLDMIHEKFGHIYPELANDKVIVDGKRILLQAANKVIAISESTKRDIVEIYGTDPGKIEVIYLGSSMPQTVSNRSAIISEKYILFVGNRERYKNFSFFLKSIADLLTGTIVICAGGGKFSEEENHLIEQLNLTGKVRYVAIQSDDTLVNLYANAACFAFPSLYEGFGIPVLEAFSCGCPCVLSNKSSLPEVGGDAAVYFDPESASSINTAIYSVLNNEYLKQQKMEEGYGRLTHFSWDKTRAETFNLYESLL